jgi:hypothetical protein
MEGNSSLEKGLLQSMIFLIKKKNGRIGQIEGRGRGKKEDKSWKEGRGERKR